MTLPTDTDQPTDIRPGEDLHPDALAAYLREHIPGLSQTGELEIRQFPGGFSNLTYLVEDEGLGGIADDLNLTANGP